MSEPMPGGPAATSDLLAGTRWRIVSVDGVPAVEGEILEVDFGHDGRASGSTGVNRFTASYSVTAEYLTFGPLATTRRMGPPELVEQEARVVQSLAGMCSYRFEGLSLVIDGPLGRVELASTLPAPFRPASVDLDAPSADQPL
jgi:heat shock protein HslJ